MDSYSLLNALNSQPHHKHSYNPSSEYLIEQSLDNEFADFETPQVGPDPPEPLFAILQSQSWEHAGYQQKITAKRKQRENNVFLAYNESPHLYLKQFHQRNKYSSNQIDDLLQKKLHSVVSDLINGKLLINRERTISNKSQLQKVEQLDRARRLKIREGTIRNKLELLNAKFEQVQKIEDVLNDKPQEDQLSNKFADLIQHSNHASESQKTKMASDYIKHLAQLRKQQRSGSPKSKQRVQIIEQSRIAELKEADSVRKQQLQHRIEQKKRKRKEEQEQMAAKKAQIHEFLAVYQQSEPVFEKYQKQFQQRYVLTETERRQQRLREIKESRRSCDFSDIAQHQKKYEGDRLKHQQRKSLEQQLYLDSQKISPKRYYRGPSHKIVDQRNREARQKVMAAFKSNKNRKDRMQQYARLVQEEKKPKVDVQKREQLLRSLESEKMKKEKMVKKHRQVYNSDGNGIAVESFFEKIPQKNRHLEGRQHLEYSKSKRNKQIRSSSEIESLESEKVKRVRKSFMHEKCWVDYEPKLWGIRQKQIRQLCGGIHSPKELERVRDCFEHLDRKAFEREQVLKNSALSTEDQINSKSALDHFYIESIKNKMKLLDD